MDIQAAVVGASGEPFSIETVMIDAPRDDEVLLRIAGVGLCHTDLLMQSGVAPFPFPAVFGHEGAGVVEAVGAKVREFAVGDHVVSSFLSCGACRQCATDAPAYCADLVPLNYSGTRSDGTATLHQDGRALGSQFFGQSSFASHALTHERNLVKVPRDLPLELLGPLGCGVQTGAGAVLNSLDMDAGESLLVAGAGAVGLSAVMAAALRACEPIIVLEPVEERRALALELGATHALDPLAQDVAEAIAAILPGGVDAALDSSGKSEVLELCALALATRGTLGILGTAAADTRLPGTSNGLLSRGLTIRGIIEGDSDPKVFIPELLHYYQDGRFPFDRMIRRYPLSAINAAVADHAAGKTIKAVLIPD